MNLNKKESMVEWYEKSEIMRELKNYTGRDNPTTDNLLEYLFGDNDGWIASDIKFYRYQKCKKNFIQRLNCFWAWPIFIITIPIQYLLMGHTGVDRESMMGRTIKFLTGEF